MSVATLNPVRLASCLPKSSHCLAQQNSVFFWSRQFGQTPDAVSIDLSAGEMDKTYTLELVRDVLPLWNQKDEKYHNKDVKPVC